LASPASDPVRAVRTWKKSVRAEGNIDLPRCNVVRAEKRFDLPPGRSIRAHCTFIRTEVRALLPCGIVNPHEGRFILLEGRLILLASRLIPERGRLSLFLARMSLHWGRLTLHQARVDLEQARLDPGRGKLVLLDAPPPVAFVPQKDSSLPATTCAPTPSSASSSRRKAARRHCSGALQTAKPWRAGWVEVFALR